MLQRESLVSVFCTIYAQGCVSKREHVIVFSVNARAVHGTIIFSRAHLLSVCAGCFVLFFRPGPQAKTCSVSEPETEILLGGCLFFMFCRSRVFVCVSKQRRRAIYHLCYSCSRGPWPKSRLQRWTQFLTMMFQSTPGTSAFSLKLGRSS